MPENIQTLSMHEPDLITRYNYAESIPEKFEPWMNFESSPPLGMPAPDYPLWDLDQVGTSLQQLVLQNSFTIVEFGSFT
jgi:hypothetical protein